MSLSGHKPKRRAVMTETVKAKFTTWKKGSLVLARLPAGSRSKYCSVERIKWVGLLPLLNQCYGIPRKAVKFLE